MRRPPRGPASILVLLALGGIAGAATPFGDEPGFIPPDVANLKYETTVGRNLAKFQACVIKNTMLSQGDNFNDQVYCAQ